MNIVLSLLACVLFIYVFIVDVKAYSSNGGLVRNAPYFKFSVFTFIIVILSVALVNGVLKDPVLSTSKFTFAFSVLLSALISRVWLLYIKWIDIFEPERNIYLGMVFILSCLTVFLVFPISDYIQSIGFVLNGDPVNDFLYCTITIGGVEEFVKLIPLLIVLKFTNQINEPIDYIVYASVSALGFAFIENVLYIQNTDLVSFSARLLYSSVAHMFFSSIVGYVLAIDAIKDRKLFLPHLIIGLLLASLAHGFYDFWLINKEFYLPFITTAFYIGSLHIWVTLKNNLINHTNFYRPDIKLDRNRIKYRLLTNLVLTIYIGYIIYAVLNGASKANMYIATSALSFLFLVVYISISFSSFNIIRGYLAPIRFPINFFLPKMIEYPNYSGVEITLISIKNREEVVYGRLVKRLVLQKDYNWYLFEEEGTENQHIIKPKEYKLGFEMDRAKEVLICDYKTRIEHSILHIESSKISMRKKGLAYLI